MVDTLSETPIQKKFKETAAVYASQSGSVNNVQNKESFYADLDSFVKESLAAGKTPDEIKRDLSQTLNEIRSDGLSDDNKFGNGKITTMQNRADKAMDRIARYYDAVNGIAMPANTQDPRRTPEEKFRESAIAYAVQSGAEKNNENKKSFYADLDVLMCDYLAKGMAPQEMKETINKVLNDVNTEILAADHKFAAGKVTTMINWADKAADQIAGYYDVMKRNEGKENMAENLQDVENTTLPAVRGQEMPAKTQETQQEQPDLHPVRVEQTAETANTVLPAVRGNAMPERAQEPIVLKGQEANLLQSFGNYAQKPSKESSDAFFLDLGNLVKEYRADGMSLADATQKASKFLGQLYDRAESQNMDPQMLSNLREAKEAANKLMAHAVEASNAGPTMLNEVNAGRRNENIEDAVYEEMSTEPVVENEGNEAADTPVTPANENEGNEEDNAPVTPVNENEGNEEDNAPVAPANENEGNEGDNAPAAPANENEGNDTPAPANENQGTFGFIENEPEKENTPSTENGPAAEPAKTSDLKQQLLNTAFKNRYMLVEAENEEPQRMCPFAQLKVRTIEDKSDDEKNPYVKMELESGNRIYNRPNQVDVHYETFVTKDENGQTVRKPQITFEDCMAAVRVGMEKGWTSATLSGPDAYKEQMYLAMCAMGMKVVGYEPSEELKKEGERLAKLHAVDRDHAASVDQRFDALEAARKEAGIKEPEEIGKEFIDDMKERGLGYTPPAQNNENDSNESDGNDTAGTPPAQTHESEGNDTAGTPPAQTNESDGNDTAGTPPVQTNESDGNDTAGTPPAQTNESEGNDTAGTPPAQTNESEGNDTAGTPPAQTNESEGNDTAGTPPAQTNESEGNDTTGTPPAQTNESEGNDTAGTPAAPVIENEGQEAVQQPQQLQLPEHVENRQQEAVQQPQQLQLPAHEEQQQPQTAALVLVTPEIQNKVEAVTQASTTALAKTDPAKAQQAAAQIAATPGIANQLKLIGDTANEAKGNDVRAAQQQHQQETALVLAARNNNHTK